MEEQEYRPSDIVFVRHGESEWNAWKNAGHKGAPPAMEGLPNHKTPLTAEGLRQAQVTGKVLGKEFPEFAVVYHSPYVRTTQTAQAIVGQLSRAPSVYRDLLLVEQQFGWLDEGVFPDKKMLEQLQAMFKDLRASTGKFYANPPNGESWFNVCLRTHDFLDKIFRPQWDGKPVLVVSHAVTIATFLYHLAGRDEDEMLRIYKRDELDNCGIVHFRHNPKSSNHWDLVCWNRTVW